MWESLNLAVLTFEDLNLPDNVVDSRLWRICQQCQVVLVTANRNGKGIDTLDAVIGRENSPGSLPIFTFADVHKVRSHKTYARKVAERLLEFLLYIEDYHGTGRLYLP